MPLSDWSIILLEDIFVARSMSYPDGFFNMFSGDLERSLCVDSMWLGRTGPDA